MKIYSYIVARDFGFAPNPFYGFCTLATCKPDIRKHASNGDWVIGTGAKQNNREGYLVFAMEVKEILCFDLYWRDKRFSRKKPLLNGSLKQMYGDNIYHYDGNEWIQENSHHSLKNGKPNRENTIRDTGKTTNVLISNKFIYFGGEKKINLNIISSVIGIEENLCKKRQGHKKDFSRKTIETFVNWLEDDKLHGWQGQPFEFSRAEKIS